jgi:hypothetical protein
MLQVACAVSHDMDIAVCLEGVGEVLRARARDDACLRRQV